MAVVLLLEMELVDGQCPCEGGGAKRKVAERVNDDGMGRGDGEKRSENCVRWRFPFSVFAGK